MSMVQNSMEAILSCHPTLSTERLSRVTISCELGHSRIGPIELSSLSTACLRPSSRELQAFPAINVSKTLVCRTNFLSKEEICYLKLYCSVLCRCTLPGPTHRRGHPGSMELYVSRLPWASLSWSVSQPDHFVSDEGTVVLQIFGALKFR